MPFYKDIDTNIDAGKRTVEKLLALRKQLDRDMPPRTLKETLLLGTWNIREFDSSAYGDRIPEAFYYIAEIIDRFDLVAIQEVRQNLKPLKRLCDILGNSWKYLITDATSGKAGNNERMAFLYDSKKVHFGGLAGELVLPPVETDDPQNKYKPVTQIARTPFICGFTAGWTDFMLTTVHILYGEDKADDPFRIEEIRQVANFLKLRSLDKAAWSQNLILLGDFNIYRPEDATRKAISDAGFVIPAELQSLPSNAGRNMFYDQIAFRVREERFGTTGKAGVFNFYETVFTENDEALYITDMGNAYFATSAGKQRDAKSKSTYYKTCWRTHQMSDHLPMWVELKIDYSDDYLKRKLKTQP